jgi:hypothetical protein
VVGEERLYHMSARAGRMLALSWRKAVNVTPQAAPSGAKPRGDVSGSCGCLGLLSVRLRTGGEEGGDVLTAGRDMRFV